MPENKDGFSEEDLKNAGFTSSGETEKISPKSGDEFSTDGVSKKPTENVPPSNEKPVDIFAKMKDDAKKDAEYEPNQGEPVSAPGPEDRASETRFHHVGGPSGGKELNDAQYAEYLVKIKELEESIRGRQLGDLAPNDIYWEKKKELDKFLGSL